MAAAGCGRIVLSSRSQPTLEVQETIERIRGTSGRGLSVVEAVRHCGRHRHEQGKQPSQTAMPTEPTGVLGSSVPGTKLIQRVVKVSALSNVTDRG
jgi:polyketide synthase 5